MTKGSNERKASSTAGYTCFSRACATREKDAHFRGPDYLAEIFLPVFAKVILNIPLLRKVFMKRIAPAGIYEYVLARTKLLDDIFVESLANDFSQIVLLGAGMDTRALRFAGINQGTRIFELDIELTLQAKLDIYRRKGVKLPEELVFVPIDFNTQDIGEILQDAGYQKDHKTLFLLEGVTMYLNPDAVDRTMAFIQGTSRVGSKVVFDFIYASVIRQENIFYGEKEIFKTVSDTGEGWTFGIEAGEIERFLTERGFKFLSMLTPADLENVYLTADDGTLFGRINGTHCNVIASVSSSGRD